MVHRLRLPCLVCLLLTGCLLGASAVVAEAPETQGLRQLGFARQELESGTWERAIKSARSALRLDPTLYEAIVIKALSLEQLGEPEQAIVLLEAYLDFTIEDDPDERALDALDRLDRVRRRMTRQAAPDIATNEQTVADLLADGRCDEAFGPARAFVTAWPDEPRGWIVLGDVQRCAMRNRSAAAAYERARELGDTSEELTSAITDVVAGLAVLEVELRARANAIPALSLALGNEILGPDSFDRGVARFEHLPPGRAVVISAGGTGFATEYVELEPFGIAEVRRVTVAPSWVGLGSVRVIPWSDAIDGVELMSDLVRIPARPGEEIPWTVGLMRMRVTGAAGTLDVPIEVQDARLVTLDPGRWVPVAVQLEGLPTGASVAIDTTRGAAWTLEHEVPRGDGTLDVLTGIFVAPPWSTTLPAGAVTLRVEHPRLGEAIVPLTVSPGEAIVFDPSTMSRASELRQEWSARAEVSVDRPRRARPLPAVISAVAGGTAMVMGGIFTGLALDARRAEAPLYESYVLAVGTGADSVTALSAYEAQRETTRARATLAGVLGGMGVVGVGVAVPLGVLSRPRARAGDWNPDGF